MTKVAFKRTEDPKVRELARNVVKVQQREMEQMRAWRKGWYPEG